MNRAEAAAKIASGELRWGLQRDMFIRDRLGHELSRQDSYNALFNWALSLPKATFLYYVTLHAPACPGCSCSGDPEAEHGCNVSPGCLHEED